MSEQPVKVYKFWFGCRQFESTKPALTMGEIVKMANASPHNLCFQDMLGARPDRGIGHGERVDLTNEPHFYCTPPATTHRGIFD